MGERNDFEIACRGDEMILKVNGKLANLATRRSQSRGALAPQSEGMPIECRDIKLLLLEK